MRDERLPEGWCETELGCIGIFFRGRGGTRIDEELNGLPCIRYGDLYTHHDCIVRSFCSAISPGRVSSYTSIQSGDVVFAGSGETFEEIGKAAAYCDDGEAYAGADTIIFRPKPELVSRFAGYAVNGDHANSYKSRMGQGSSVIHISAEHLSRLALRLPPFAQQQRIAEILSTVDEAIEQTEALIAKTQQIKAGLMHDLFTRGVTPDGQLRPPREEAPQLYKKSPLGWIPKAWDPVELGLIADSLIDGPFGSNLKTEHYVEGEGVRVVRLQNILCGEYNDNDQVRISNRYATTLVKHQVLAGDVLIAALGDDNHPVGRSCCYPATLPPAINKADCFRLRCKASTASNSYVMGFLNTVMARRQIRRYEQGVTRRRVNMGNLRRVVVALPSMDEQQMVIDAVQTATHKLSKYSEDREVQKLIKAGLMHDLLTGRVRVTVDTSPEPAEVTASV